MQKALSSKREVDLARAYNTLGIVYLAIAGISKIRYSCQTGNCHKS